MMNRPQTPPPSSSTSPQPQPHARSRAKKLTNKQRIEARYAANAVHLSPTNSSGRPPVLSSKQVDEIEAFVISSPEHRQLTYFELDYAYLSHLSHFGASEKVIQRAMSRSE
ncbi:hypothetical protein K3495_g9295 [Podosphaera aphanis]|nr:hypothetical protein K3495_g9295 [Podosphaera aphanis]